VTEAEGDTLLTGLVADILRVPAADILDSLDMESTGTWDSLSHMQLIAAIEDEFALELTLDEIVAMRSVGQIKDVLRARSAVA
jgi:acyl carrier protein